MELPDLGKNCIICNRNDYLPFQCSHCDKIVCIDHKVDHGSDCPLHQAKSSTDDNSRLIKGTSLKAACDFCRKITLKLELTDCPHCQSKHCLYHRHQVQHECVKLKEVSREREINDELIKVKQSEALQRLREKINYDPSKHSTLQPSTHKSKPIVDPKKLALIRRLRIMKIKQIAKGPPNIETDERLYFEIKFEHEARARLSNHTKDGSIARIFASAKHSIGRLIDFSADELKLINNNNVEGSDLLVFRILIPDGTYLELDSQTTFSKYLDSEQLASGDEMILTYKPFEMTQDE